MNEIHLLDTINGVIAYSCKTKEEMQEYIKLRLKKNIPMGGMHITDDEHLTIKPWINWLQDNIGK